MADQSPNPASPRTSSSSSSASSLDVLEKPLGPPPLNYDLKSRKLSIFVCWAILLVDTVLLAICLYYPLTYATNLESWKVMTIVTCVVGIISLAQFIWRTWVLVRRDASKRPIDGRRWQLDAFNWIYIAGICIVAVELVLGTFGDEPNIKLCSMPLASILFLGAGCEIIPTTGYFLSAKLPVRVSSLSRGESCRPGIYTVIEDVIAVDGGAGLEYRIALDTRYRASPEFRSLLARMSLFWSLPAFIVGAFTTAMIWTTPDPVAFGIGWTIPFLWVVIWMALTIPYCQHLLAKERNAWLQRGSSS